MPTDIVFCSAPSVRVTADVEMVTNDIENKGYGRPLLRYELDGKKDAHGNPRTIRVNWITIAYIEDATLNFPPAHAAAQT